LIEISIYPNYEEYKEVTEMYLREHFSEFLRSMTKKEWNTYYAKNISRPVII